MIIQNLLSKTQTIKHAMHHHNKIQRLSKNDKVLFTGKKTELQKTGKGSYAPLQKRWLLVYKKWLRFNKAAGKEPVGKLL